MAETTLQGLLVGLEGLLVGLLVCLLGVWGIFGCWWTFWLSDAWRYLKTLSRVFPPVGGSSWALERA